MGTVITNRKSQLMLCSVLVISTFLEGFNETSVNIVLPKIAMFYSISVGDASWVSTVYTLSMAGLILVFGKVCDRGAMKTVLLSGTLLFMGTALLCAFAPSYPLLLVFRALQGAGGATLWCAALMLGVKYLPRHLVAMALMSTTIGETMGSILGPLITSALTIHFDWQAIFITNAIIGCFATFMTWSIVPKDNYQKLKNFDYLGSVLLFTAMFSGAYCLEVAIYDGFTPMSIGLLFLSIATLIALFFSSKRAEDPLVNPSLFRSRRANGYTAIYIIGIMCGAGSTYLMMFYVVVVLGMGSVESGIINFIMGMVTLITSFILGWLVIKLGSRVLVTFSATITTSLCTLLFFIELNPMLIMCCAAALYGLVWAAGEIVLVPSIINSMPDDKRGAASALNTFFSYAAVAFGAALFSKLFVLGSGAGNTSIENLTPDAFVTGFLFTMVIGIIMGAIAIAISIIVRDKARDMIDGP